MKILLRLAVLVFERMTLVASTVPRSVRGGRRRRDLGDGAAGGSTRRGPL